MVKLFVGNVNPGSNAEELKKIFEVHGTVTECDIVKNVAFVHMSTESEAHEAINNVNNTTFNGGKLSVEMGREKRGRGGAGGPMRGRGRGGPGYGSDDFGSRFNPYDQRGGPRGRGFPRGGMDRGGRGGYRGGPPMGGDRGRGSFSRGGGDRGRGYTPRGASAPNGRDRAPPGPFGNEQWGNSYPMANRGRGGPRGRGDSSMPVRGAPSRGMPPRGGRQTSSRGSSRGGGQPHSFPPPMGFDPYSADPNVGYGIPVDPYASQPPNGAAPPADYYDYPPVDYPPITAPIDPYAASTVPPTDAYAVPPSAEAAYPAGVNQGGYDSSYYDYSYDYSQSGYY